MMIMFAKTFVTQLLFNKASLDVSNYQVAPSNAYHCIIRRLSRLNMFGCISLRLTLWIVTLITRSC